MTSTNDLHTADLSDQRESTSAILSAGGSTPILIEVLPSWQLALDSAGLSPRTVTSYSRTIREFCAWLIKSGMPATVDDVTTEHIRAYLAAELKRTTPGNADKHRRNLNVFFNWLEEEGEREASNPMKGVKAIKVPETAGEVFTDDQLRALVKACEGNDFEARRDLAIIRVFMDNGIRVSGMAGIRFTPDNPDTHDIDLQRRRLRITLKGGNQIWVPIGAKAAHAVDRYIRIRRRHKAGWSPYLWLPNRALMTRDGECRFTATGIAQMIERRGKQAGIDECTPHKFRRTMATKWEGDSLTLMDIGGWQSLDMVRHYQRAARQQRAMDAHRQLSPGDKI